MRRWLVKEVGLNDDGTAKDCVIFYDYLKLMDTSGMDKDLKEYQLLGFMMTSLHNFAVKYQVPIMAFIQLNRDGITKESTDSASGSTESSGFAAILVSSKEKQTKKSQKMEQNLAIEN